ncbi:MAG TPA: type II toxin-antitoxin system PemK/MazF family toxin [Rhodoferax sp.]|nr:type II toxin-antitoxin system PemK/MazF family toxin [Rhodoferax sp.]
MTASIERGDVYWVELDPTHGAEITKTRPCFVLSASEINQHRKTVVVIPLTTTATPAAPPLLIAVPSAGASSKARIEHIRAVDKSRLQRKLGRLGAQDLHAVEEALRRVLRLPKD